MNVLMLAVNDPAGTGIQFCRAVNAHTNHTCRLATLETRYTHSWQADLHVPDLDEAGIEELGELFRTVDILHFHMTADENLRFGPYLPADFLHCKTVVHHHHGHHDFRSDPDSFREKYRRLGRNNLLVSTPDLLKLLPEARWQPNLVPLNDPALLPRTDRPGPEAPLRVAHSPTRKDLKNTDEFLRAVEALRSEGVALDLDLMDDVPNAECLARKARCHVLFDHMQGYYGVSSLEGLSQGLAVIAGLDDWNRKCIMDFTGASELPWLIARDEDSLLHLLRDLARDRDLCDRRGRESREFMETYWSDVRMARNLVSFWENC